MPLPLLHLRQRHLRLRQPAGHVHGAVEVDGSHECRAGLLRLVCLGIQCTEAVVAVRLERAHAQLFNQGQGLVVVPVGWLDHRGLALRRHLAQEPQGPCLVAALLLRPGEGLLGEASRTLGFFPHPLQ